MAPWENGAPYRIKPDDLNTMGRINLNSKLKEVPFSAHPHHDADGSIWNFGEVSSKGKGAIVIFQLSASGKLMQHNKFQCQERVIHMILP